MTEEAKNELSDVSVETVGLVTQGANRKKFFLLKSREEAEEMPKEKTVVESEGQQEGEGLLDSIKGWLDTRFTKLDSRLDEMESVPEVLDESTEQDEPEVEIIEKIDLLLSESEELKKANLTLVARLEKAETEAEEQLAKRQVAEYLEKAKAYTAIPAKSEELAEQLLWLNKSDPKRSEYWESLLKAMSNQASDSELFQEVGTTDVGKGDFQSIMKKGTPDQVKKALEEFTPEEGEKYLLSMRAKIKGVK